MLYFAAILPGPTSAARQVFFAPQGSNFGYQSVRRTLCLFNLVLFPETKEQGAKTQWHSHSR